MTSQQALGTRRAARLDGMDVSLIVRITEQAAALKRAGRDVVSLGTGEPDFDTPVSIKDAGKRAIDAGDTKYTANAGSSALKTAIVAKYAREGVTLAANQIIASTGAKQVIFNALMATLDPGDEVIVPAPFWTSYADMIVMAGGRAIIVATNQSDSFLLTAEALAAAITPRTRWLLLNSPSNPSGAAYSAAQLQALLAPLESRPQIGVMADEIYEQLCYGDFAFKSLLAACPRFSGRTLVINGVSKAYAMTGWRLGYGVGPADLIAAMAVVQGQITSAPSSISQAAAVEALNGSQDEVAERRAIFQVRRDLVVAGLNAIDGVDCFNPPGAFYVFPNCEALLGRRTPNGQVVTGDIELCEYFLDRAGVAVVPGTAFGTPGHFRISYAYAETALREALSRLARACDDLVA